MTSLGRETLNPSTREMPRDLGALRQEPRSDTKYYHKRCSWHLYRLVNYTGLGSSGQELATSTGTHISYYITIDK